MLTVKRLAAGLLVGMLAGLAGVTVATVPATALEPGCTAVQIGTGDNGKAVYRIDCPGDDGGGDPGGGGGTKPTCALTGLYEYCIGVSACWANVPSALDPATWPEESRPSPEAVYTFQFCDPGLDNPLTGWSWYTPSEMTVAQAARQAYGMLATPGFSVGFSPPGRAIVGFPMWLWAQTAQSGTITGSAALGVVAIGEPDGLEVDPGDGSGVLSCAWSTVASGDCSYTYGRSSVGQPVDGDGLPAYPVRMRLVYQVRFENNGAPFVAAGLPATLESAWQTTSVPVAEIQALVTLGRS